MANNTNVAQYPLAVLKPEKAPRLYTLSEYLHREERANELHEYYNGIINKLPMAKGTHNIIVFNIGNALMNAFQANVKDYTIFGSQQLVYLPELNFTRYPDVLVIAETPKYWDKNEVLLINPLLIVEVLSRSTKKYDSIGKFEEYKTLESFSEYVLIDPEKSHIKTHFREAPNLWRDTICKDISDKIELKSVDCAIEMSAIYKKIVFKTP